MKNLVKGIALVGAATTAGVGASQRRDHLQLQGPVTNCYLGPAIECTQNATHILFSSQAEQTMMVKGPNGIYTVEAEHGHPLGNQPPPPPPPPPVVPKPTKNPLSTPPPALAQYLDPARPGTPAPAQPRTPAPPKASSSNFHLDLVVGLGVAFTFLTIIGCAVLRHIHRHTRNGIPAEIQMATITNERNVVAPQPNSLLGTIQEDLRVTRDNVLPHRQLVYNAIPTPTSLPSYNGIRGVPLNPQNQQPQVSANLNSEGLASAPPGLPPSPPLSPPPPPLPLNDGQSSSRQPASNSGDLHLPSQLRGINLQGGIVQVDSSIGFVGSRHAPLQQPVSENPDHGAHQVSASSRTHSPSTNPSRSRSASPVEYHDIEPGPPPQYR